MLSERSALLEYGTPVISDAMDELGLDGYLDIKPLGSYALCAPIITIAYAPVEPSDTLVMKSSNYLDELDGGHVLFIDNQGRSDCSVWGGILSTMAKRKGMEGTIIHGCARDAQAVNQSAYPVFAKGLTPRTGKSRARMVHVNQSLSIEGTTIHPGDIALADAHGVLIIPASRLTQVCRAAKTIAFNESNILASINKGLPLARARELHHYNQPTKESV